MKIQTLIFLGVFILSGSPLAFAGGAVAAQRQKATQEQMMRQRALIQQRIAAEQQQAIQQEIEQHNQQMLHQRFMEKKRQEEELKEYIEARKAGRVYQPRPTAPPPAPVYRSQVLSSSSKAPTQVARAQSPGTSSSQKGGGTTHVDENNIWKSLNRSSALWIKVVQPEDKVYIVEHYINIFQTQGVAIRKGPQHYAVFITDMIHSNPPFLNQPFDRLLQMAAVMEYDFDNGQSKDALAKALLGETGYIANKRRLGAK